jgi:hypothetical protein
MGDIWYASFTTFVDDYKLRGQGPATTVHGFFSTREKAEAFLCDRLYKVLKNNGVYVDEELKSDYDALDEMLKKEMDEHPAEFIPCDPYEWELINATKRIDDQEILK